MSLVLDYVAEFRRSYEGCPKYFVNLEVAVRSFSRFVGHPADWTDVTPGSLNSWIIHELDRGLSPYTMRGRRRDILRLWSCAAETGLAVPRAGRVRSVTCPELIPIAFLLPELKALIAAADDLRGVYRKIRIPRRLWWRSFLPAMYDSGLRLGDMLLLERSDIWPGGHLSIIQHKTGHQHRVQFRPTTIAAIDECVASVPGRRHIWPLWCRNEHWYEHFNDLRRRAGLAQGTSRWIRRSSASYVERDRPGSGSRHLGHRSPELFTKHYRDARIVGDAPTLPPEI